MEAIKFINLLKKHKYTLIAVPLFVVAITYVLCRKLPDVYISKATLSAGLADQSQQLLADKMDMQQERTNQAFTNLIQMMQMKNVYDQVSYQLILHDLTSNQPYRKPSKLMGYLNPDAKKHAIEIYTELYNTRESLDLSNNDQKGLYEVIKSMKYDYESLSKKMKVYRVENSDFITVEFESDAPALSEIAVNTLCKEFISYYTTLTKENERKSIDFLNRLLAAKKDSLNNSMLTLKDYKIKNRVLNLNEEAKSLYAQMADYESRLQEVQKDIEANEGALESIDKKFNSNDRQYIDSKLTLINQDIIESKQQLSDLNEQYIKSGFDSSYQAKINTLKNVLAEQINQATDKYILNPLNAKEGLIEEKMKLEVAQEMAKNSVHSIQNELEKLNRKFDTLVPNEAVIQADEGDITVASQEYLEILDKYNEASLQYNSSVKVKLIEAAAIGEKQPSKKIIIVALSGIVSFVFCLLVLFILFYLDKSVQSPMELADKTSIAVLGQLPILKNNYLLDLNKLWENDPRYQDEYEFKNQLRSVRFEIDNIINGPSLLSIVSLSGGEGKSLFVMGLASAYQLIGKKVLLIDGNFNHPFITEIVKPEYFIEDLFTSTAGMPTATNNGVVILGNRGEDKSLFEISSEQVVHEKLQALKRLFDIVLIEASALNLLNKSKEWIKVSDKVLGIFETHRTIGAYKKQEVKYLHTINDKFIGWVMNKLPARHKTRKGKA